MLEVLQSEQYWDAVVRAAGPLILAALAANLCSRAGVLFVGVEGTLLTSAFFAIAGALWTDAVWIGVLAGAGAGLVTALGCGWLSMQLRMGDIIAGLVLFIGSTGLTAFLAREWFPLGLSLGDLSLGAVWPEPSNTVLHVIFGQQPLIYVAVALAIGMTLFLRTRMGLALRVSGESVRVGQRFGLDLVRLRYAVLAVAGVITGLGGAVLGLAIAGGFTETMVNGRGFIALACVILGGWRPIGVMIAALVFGAADAYQFQANVEAVGGYIAVLPYVLTLAALGFTAGRRLGPAEEGRDLPEPE